jgi:transglutaminase-like putative cysteine protease
MKAQLTIMAAVATMCGSIALYPLFVSSGWFWSGLGAILVVSATGALIRRYRLPAWVNLAGGLAALHLYLTALYAADTALLGIIPTPSSLARLGELLNEGWQAAHAYMSPVPLIPGISLFATLGIGIVAVTVDLLAVRLRRAAPAGLPLLALYSVPAAIIEEKSISWLAFGIGAAGFLALLLVDSRAQVTSWGRPVFTSRWSEDVPRERPNAGALALTGRRIGLTAVAAAILLPTMVPGVQPRDFFGVGGGAGDGDGRGGRTVTTTLDPLVSLKRELTRTDDGTVLSYRTNDQRPDYLRLYALDLFDGNRWTYRQLSSGPRERIRDGALPPAPGLAIPAAAVTTRISIEDNVDMRFLPLPYPPSRIDVDGDWRVHSPSLMVYSTRDEAGGRSYDVNSLKVNPSAAQLDTAGAPPPDVMAQYTGVPNNIPAQVLEIAEEVTGAAPSAYQKAVALQEWFTNGQFIYSLAAREPKQTSDLMDFLTISKTGYCEQFAASMALMARLLKIPARVAMGYTPGTRDDKGNWVVQARDTHAWPELYFAGVGWVRFEPTPAGALGQGTATVPSYAAPAPASPNAPALPAPSTSAGAESSAAPSPGASQAVRDPELLGPAGLPDAGGGRVPYGWIAAGGVVLALLLTPLVAGVIIRRRRWTPVKTTAAPAPAGAGPGPAADGPAGRDDLAGLARPGTGGSPEREIRAAHAAWAGLRADAIDYRVDWRPAESPRAVARRLAVQLSLDGAAADALSRITMAEERARYAPSPGMAGSLRADSRAMRRAFAESADRWTRFRAIFFPPSALAAFRASAARMLDILDRIENLAFNPRLPGRSRSGS